MRASRIMTMSRRRMLATTSSAVLAAGLGSTSADAQAPRRLGLIFPPAGRGVPEEGLAMYGSRIEYVIENLGLETMTPEGYEAVLHRVGPCAERLAEGGAEAILLTGTSLTFFKGEDYNRQLIELVEKASGLKATSMSSAVIDGLKHFGVTRIAAATAYNDEVNQRLRSFLVEHGFEVLAVQGLGIEAVGDIFSVTQPQLIEFGSEVAASVEQPEALLVSCGGLRTLEILDPLEIRTGIPAVSSMPHTLYAGAKLLGMDPRVPGYGLLMES
jgi:arylmalonate decarboxylase